MSLCNLCFFLNKKKNRGKTNGRDNDADIIQERCMTAKQVGIDIHLYKARKILEDLSIPIDCIILQLATEGGVQLRKKRFSGDYADLNVVTDSETMPSVPCPRQ